MRAITKLLGAVAVIAISSAAATASQAAIFIGLQEAGVSGGAITTVASGSFAAAFLGSYGTFTMELLTGTEGVDPTILGSTTSDNVTTSGGTLDIYVTRDGITGPIPAGILSTFTSNALPAGWSVTQSTFLSTSNALYTGSLLSSHVFSAIGTFGQSNLTGGGAGPYSVTTRYTLNAPTGGTSLSTISMHAVPEPATWALMIMGFGGAGAMLRSRRRQAIAA